MKLSPVTCFVVCLIIFPVPVLADTSANDPEVLAIRGKGVVTQQKFAARADKIPSDLRLATLRDGNRLRDVINNLLLQAQLAEDAREAGLDKKPVIVERMQLAAEAELAEAWLQEYIRKQPVADFEALAYEYYQLHREEIKSSPKVDVTHILISSEERSDAEAKDLAESLYQQIVDNPAVFDELVRKFSDDPSVSSNKGKFKNVRKGDMVKAFEDAAFALQPGEISTLVRTGFGYHIIRLDGYHAPEIMRFEDVKVQLMNSEREKHQERIKRDYLSSLTSLDVEMTEGSLVEMVRRQFGEEMIDSEVNGENSE